MKKEAERKKEKKLQWSTEEETSAAVPEPSQGHCPHRTSHVTIRRLALLFAYNQTYLSALAKSLLSPHTHRLKTKQPE